jgi:hypothetical protein
MFLLTITSVLTAWDLLGYSDGTSTAEIAVPLVGFGRTHGPLVQSRKSFNPTSAIATVSKMLNSEDRVRISYLLLVTKRTPNLTRFE